MKEGWEYKKLNSICLSIEDGDWIESKDQSQSGIRLIQTGNIGNGSFKDKPNSAKYISEETFKKLHCTEVFEGDILVSRLPDPVGRACILPDIGCRSITAVDCSILKIKEDLVYNEWITYYMQSQAYFTKIKNQCTGSTRQRITRKKLAEIQIPVPPLSEQQSIVDYLDSAFAKIDAMKVNAEKALNEAKALFQASLKEMLEPKDGWEEKKLQEVAYDFSRGKSKHRPRNDKKLFGGKYPFIQTGEIRNANVYVTSHSSTYNEIGLSQSKLWPKDTVCITIAANIAEVAILKYPSCFPDSVIGFVADRNKVDKLFVFYSLLKYQQELKKQGKGSAQDNINLGTFEKNYFPFPSLDEQQSIVATLDSLKSKVDRLKANYDKISQECDALKQAILRQVFE